MNSIIAMESYEWFEVAMLLCFSVGWYWSIVHMLRVKVASGKSVMFVLLVIVGYACGVVSRTLLWIETEEFSLVLIVYVWNLIVTIIDIFLVLHYSKPRERRWDVSAKATSLWRDRWR
ncbi:MAG: hypothetical protein ROR55_22280 [Devosia sp.]